MSKGIDNTAHTENVRKFATGATRNSDQGKYDYEAFNCPAVDERYAEFMHKHRHLDDGTLRAGDNWQKGIPVDQLLKSMTRHFTDVRLHQRGFSDRAVEPLQDSLCALIFGAKAMLRDQLVKTPPMKVFRESDTSNTVHLMMEEGVSPANCQATWQDYARFYTDENSVTVDSHGRVIDRVEAVANQMLADRIAVKRRNALQKLANTPHFYIAGPMRGLAFANFPAFDKARDLGNSLGYQITSPADLDRGVGVDPIVDPPSYANMTAEDVKACIDRDLDAIKKLRPERGDGLAVLPNYQNSVGAVAEIATANWMGLKVVSALDFKTPLVNIMPMVSAMKVLMDWGELGYTLGEVAALNMEKVLRGGHVR